MSEHTTGLPAAIASSSTMPKLSLPVAGDTKMSAVAYQRGRSAAGTAPMNVDVLAHVGLHRRFEFVAQIRIADDQKARAAARALDDPGTAAIR